MRRPMNEERGKEIGARIVAAREEAGMTQADLADLLTVHVRALGNYERGERIP